MNLIVDIGNTRIKAAVFSNSELNQFFSFENTVDFIAALEKLTVGVNHSLLCTVVADFQLAYEALSKRTSCLLFNAETVIPIKNLYRSVPTLGSDRLAAAVGANSIFENLNVLNIDTGTCIKYNFVTASGEFVGGAIAPGLKMRLSALHRLTSRLPLVEFDAAYTELIGKDTVSSILSGTLVASVYEMDGLIHKYKEQFPDLKIIVSGGDTDFFEKRLKNSIFARPNLVLEGLNKILEYNVRN